MEVREKGPVTRVAALYDTHGNLPALETVLDDVRHANVNEILIGGDIVPGLMPREALTRLLELKIPTQFIYGNGELAVLAQIGASGPANVTSFDEYRRMFSMTEADLGRRIVGCGDEPASFNAEASRRGFRRGGNQMMRIRTRQPNGGHTGTSWTESPTDRPDTRGTTSDKENSR